MPKRDDIKRLLRNAALAANKRIDEQQLGAAAEQLVKKASVQKQDLRLLGESVAHDPEIFAATDTDDMNDVLGRLGDR
jgi:hypothetical protein